MGRALPSFCGGRRLIQGALTADARASRAPSLLPIGDGSQSLRGYLWLQGVSAQCPDRALWTGRRIGEAKSPASGDKGDPLSR
jgi:hypothetical protein